MDATTEQCLCWRHEAFSLVLTKPVFRVSYQVQSDTNRAVQPQKMSRGLIFQYKEVEELYYQCSENKGADQFGSYREADLRLCFGIYAKSGFSNDTAHIVADIVIK